jgi:hypothetical protein
VKARRFGHKVICPECHLDFIARRTLRLRIVAVAVFILVVAVLSLVVIWLATL